MAELKRPIFIHPTVPLNQNYLMDLVPVPVLAFMVDNTLAAMRLALAGVLAEYAAAPIIIPHVGATVPYLMSRLDGMMEHFGGPSALKEPSRFLKQLYMDTVAYRTRTTPVVFLAPWAQANWFWEQTIEEEREQIRHGNAERLFLP